MPKRVHRADLDFRVRSKQKSQVLHNHVSPDGLLQTYALMRSCKTRPLQLGYAALRPFAASLTHDFKDLAHQGWDTFFRAASEPIRQRR